MRAHPPTRTLLVFIVLASLILALPAAGRTPRPVDILEGDPGDGVLSPRFKAAEEIMPTPAPETAPDESAGTASVVTIVVAPAHRPLHLPLAGRFWFDAMWGFLHGAPWGYEGRWHHAR